MEIKNLTLEDLKKNIIYQYICEDSKEIVAIEDFNENSIAENTGYYLITGSIKLKDGTEYPSIFGISSDDGGEMFEYYFITEKGWVSSGNDLCKVLNKRKMDIFPFKYHLNYKVIGDLHTEAQY